MRTDEEGTAFVFQTDASVMGQDTKDARERPERAELGTPAGLGLRATAGREDGGSDGPRLRLGQGLRSICENHTCEARAPSAGKRGSYCSHSLQVPRRPPDAGSACGPDAPPDAGCWLCTQPRRPDGRWLCVQPGGERALRVPHPEPQPCPGRQPGPPVPLGEELALPSSRRPRHSQATIDGSRTGDGQSWLESKDRSMAARPPRCDLNFSQQLRLAVPWLRTGWTLLAARSFQALTDCERPLQTSVCGRSAASPRRVQLARRLPGLRQRLTVTTSVTQHRRGIRSVCYKSHKTWRAPVHFNHLLTVTIRLY